MSKFTDRVDMRFSYTTAANSAKPGYLAKKFRDAQKQIDAEAARKAAEADAAKSTALDIEVEQQRKVRRIAK